MIATRCHRRWVGPLALCLAGCGGDGGGSDGGPVAQDSSVSDASLEDGGDAHVSELSSSVIVDTFVRRTEPTFNFGARDRTCADTATDDRIILLRVDVAEVPSGAAVVGASLRVRTGALAADLSTDTFSIYQVLEEWSEGDQDGVAGVASGNERTTGTAWTAEGVGAGSRGETVVGSFVPDAIDTAYEVDLDPALVQGWVDDPSSNHGVAILAGGMDGSCFATTESAIAGRRPSLVITWNDR